MKIKWKHFEVIGALGAITSVSALLTLGAEVANGFRYSLTSQICAGIVAAVSICLLALVYIISLNPDFIDVDSIDDE